MMVGASPWNIMYEVNVKFIRVDETWKSAVREFNAGKYMFAETCFMCQSNMGVG